jgi:hypothetical protein
MSSIPNTPNDLLLAFFDPIVQKILKIGPGVVPMIRIFFKK